MFLSALTTSFGLVLAGQASAQTFTIVHSFTGGIGGGEPYAELISSGNTLYGTTYGDGLNGTVFKVNTDGTGFVNLHNFSYYPNSDGANPWAGLVLSSNTLFGTALNGGSLGWGTVFKVNTNAGGFVNLHNFTDGSDGVGPQAGLVLSGNTLYGAATSGGSPGVGGTVFAINTDGTGFRTVYDFTSNSGYDTNSDGGGPAARLILSGNTLYGTTTFLGPGGNGTVFAVNTEGTGFRIVHSFSAYPSYPAPQTNSDGAYSLAILTLSSNTLYGTAVNGGSSGKGTVFKVDTDGTGFTNLHNFTGDNGGRNPWAGLVLSGDTLYGTTVNGGISNNGTVFKVNTDGTGFVNLHNFTGGNDGASPLAGLILSSNILYGTTSSGGSSGSGTVFSILLPPSLTITRAGPDVILSWPTNAAGFSLQSTTNLIPPVWTTNSPAPVVVNGQNTVTNPISGTRKFYRLVQ